MKLSTISLVTAAVLLSGCVKEQVSGGTSSTLGPSLVIEQFMRALNSEPKDLTTMGRLFGTSDGPILDRDPRAQVEQRMFAIATVLHHDDYEMVREQQVPGRTNEATQVFVRVKQGSNNNPVPFTLVRYKGGWLIEQIGIDVITNQR
ncbi:MAG TPA: hypothetical protein VFO52_03140 [Longimicrobiales bacterium]|nr:hypothetical protein [Longimicrobiales bacterium]